MGEKTEIAWTDATFNPWHGCVRVSPGCENCYAEAFAKRTGHNIWGPASTTPRRLFGEKHWNEPRKWDRAAAAEGKRRRVFCASMADVFEDNLSLAPERLKLWTLIHETQNLDWLLLTKRPENLLIMLPWGQGGAPWPNVWIGTTAEDQQRADARIPLLAAVPAVVRFVSVEPQIGPISLRRWLEIGKRLNGSWEVSGFRPEIDWVIIGGESGPKARPFDVQWAIDLVAECRVAEIAPFVKQLGDAPREQSGGSLVKIREFGKKGGDFDRFPIGLQVREFPIPRIA